MLKTDYDQEYTQGELEMAFDLVKDPSHWKEPIDAFIPDRYDLNLIREAIIHFTGTLPSFSKWGEDKIRVMADGYRLGPCGDY